MRRRVARGAADVGAAVAAVTPCGMGHVAGGKVGPLAQDFKPQERAEGMSGGNGWRCSYALARILLWEVHKLLKLDIDFEAFGMSGCVQETLLG